MITTVFGSQQGYRKLAPTRMTPIGSSRLMEGQDHLLQIEIRGFQEIHKRFYFSEIRAITVQPSRTGMALHLFIGGLVLLLGSGLAATLVFGSPLLARLVQVIIGILVVIAGIWLIHLLRGRSCSCHVITTVQNEKIPALWRFPATRATLERLAPRIQAAQRQLELEPATETPSVNEGQLPLFTAPPPAPAVDAKWSRPVNMALFSLCLANAAVLFGNLLVAHLAFDIAETVLLLSLLGVPLVAIVGNRKNRTLRLLGWVTLICSVVTFLGWYGLQVSEAIARSETPSRIWSTLGTSPYRSPYTLWMTVGSGTWNLLLGLVGWLLLLTRKTTPARPDLSETPATPRPIEGEPHLPGSEGPPAGPEQES